MSWPKSPNRCVNMGVSTDFGLDLKSNLGMFGIKSNFSSFFFAGSRVGRADGGDGEHADPPLRGGAPPALLQRHDGHLLQGQVHRSLGNGE